MKAYSAVKWRNVIYQNLFRGILVLSMVLTISIVLFMISSIRDSLSFKDIRLSIPAFIVALPLLMFLTMALSIIVRFRLVVSVGSNVLVLQDVFGRTYNYDMSSVKMGYKVKFLGLPKEMGGRCIGEVAVCNAFLLMFLKSYWYAVPFLGEDDYDYVSSVIKLVGDDNKIDRKPMDFWWEVH